MTKAMWTVAAIASSMLCAGTAVAALTPQQRCDGARIKAWRTYASCVEKLVAKDAADLPVNPGYVEAFAVCRHRYFSKWATLQGAAYAGSTCIGSRFTDNGDGTVTDNLSGLVWEKKTNLDSTANLGDPHDADNSYGWGTGSGQKEDGTAFTSFLNTLNSGAGFGGSNGWRLPTVTELQTIVLDYACTSASCVCVPPPCVDPAMDASNTKSARYWTATPHAGYPGNTWSVEFVYGLVGGNVAISSGYGRAVRGGL